MIEATMINSASISLMDLQIEALYRCDQEGRLRCVNEPGDPPAPRFFMGRTAQGNRWRFRYDLSNAVVQQLQALCHSEPVSADLTLAPLRYDAIRAALQAQAPIEGEERGPAYRIPDNIQTPPGVTLISATNAHLLQPWFMDPPPFEDPEQVVVAAIAQGVAVAICYCSRLTDRAAEAGIETAAAFRRSGYATRAAAGWAAEVQRRGRIALYSTSWDNLASQGVARKLEMRLYGEDWSIA
jgi:RimJ/RimL family protein N-acetyltransferase